VNLERAHALLAGEHEVKNLEPCSERNLGFLEDGPCLEREAVGRAVIFAAFLALPVPRSGCALVDVIVVAAGAMRAARPTAQEQVSPARLLIGKEPIKFGKRHLANEAWFGVFVIAHASDISADLGGSQQSHNPPVVASRPLREGMRKNAHAVMVSLRKADAAVTRSGAVVLPESAS
jgi:hypothetical protein